MTKTLHRVIAFAALAGCLWGASAAEAQVLAALPVPSEPAPAVGGSRPVLAWTRLCDRDPAECTVTPGEPEKIVLTRQAWQQIVGVNMRVNAAIAPLTDEDHWGVADSWDIPDDGYGDCEDYQLLKRRLLVGAGFPRRALLMTVVLDDKGEGHAVLMARTDRGDFILDNKVQGVLPWHQTGYVFVKRESAEGHRWISLGGATAPVTTANR